MIQTMHSILFLLASNFENFETFTAPLFKNPGSKPMFLHPESAEGSGWVRKHQRQASLL